MKLPRLRRRRSTAKPEEAVVGTAAVEETPIDITIPRECIYKSFEGHPGPCPRCGDPLQQSTQTYLVGTRRGRKIADTFFIASDFGWFCSHCPTMVIDPDDVDEMLQHNRPRWDVGPTFAVFGFVNLDAVPEEKRHLLLGEDDNPIPLVPFANVSAETTDSERPHRAGRAGRRRAAPARTKRRRRRKRRR